MLETARALEQTAGRQRCRRPKQLVREPILLDGDDGEGLAAARHGGGGDLDGDRQARVVFGEERADVADAEAGRVAANVHVHRTARAIAARIALSPPIARRQPAGNSGASRVAPYRGQADEVDLERTIEAMAERRPLTAEEIVVTERRLRRRAIVLLVDVSGSMRGERLHAPAAAVGALIAELARDALSVVAFSSDAALLVRLGERPTLEAVIDSLLAIEPAGLTNVSFPLQVAADELSRAGGWERRAILLSDCVHNAGPDPREAARRLPRLDVMFDASAECDIRLARDLAQAGRGVVHTVRQVGDVATGLSRILAR